MHAVDVEQLFSRVNPNIVKEKHLEKERLETAFLHETIVVIGTGDLGQGLIKCLKRGGYRVVVASRNPEKNRARVESLGGVIESYENSLQQSNIIIVAIPFEGFGSLPVEILVGKIVVDVSNRPLEYSADEPSLAQQLQETLPRSRVVKAFNTLSAYGLLNNILQGSKEVPVCSDDDEAKHLVISLIRNLGFTPVDRGNLLSAAEIEEIPLAFFPEWKLAAILSLVVFIFAFLIVLFRSQLCPNFQRQGNDTWHWELFNNLLLDNPQSTFGLTGITLLWTCYLPGVMAAYIQLFRGTKYSEFPKWLDNWLRSRKYIGLITLFMTSLHVILSFITSIEYGLKSDWMEYTFFGFGCFSFGFMAVLGITSLPSVSQTLSWREFSFVQRYLGWWALTFAVLHLIFARWSGIISNGQRCVVIPDEAQIFIVIPLITVLLKLVLILPCIDSQIQQIRRGLEIKVIQ